MVHMWGRSNSEWRQERINEYFKNNKRTWEYYCIFTKLQLERLLRAMENDSLCDIRFLNRRMNVISVDEFFDALKESVKDEIKIIENQQEYKFGE